MLSIEAAFEAAFRGGEDFYLLPREATGEVVAKSESRLRSAITAYGLAVHWEMVEIIRPLAPLVGKTDMAALYKANDAGVDLRARIENLGK